MNRTRAKLIEALETQRRALEASSKAFDNGDRWEALRLATAVCILVHDGGGKSLLAQLNVQRSARFILVTRPVSMQNLLLESPLVYQGIATGSTLTTAQYVPYLGEDPSHKRTLNLTQWWNEIVLRSGTLQMKRRELVLMLRNKEGGAHFDDKIENPSYLALTQPGPFIPHLLQPGELPLPILEIELATMRQIAWELLECLETLEISN